MRELPFAAHRRRRASQHFGGVHAERGTQNRRLVLNAQTGVTGIGWWGHRVATALDEDDDGADEQASDGGNGHDDPHHAHGAEHDVAHGDLASHGWLLEDFDDDGVLLKEEHLSRAGFEPAPTTQAYQLIRLLRLAP